MAERPLVELAAQAMRDNNRIPEPKILVRLSDAHLRAIIERNASPLYYA